MSDWQEIKTGAFGLDEEPQDHSTDNGVLFTCVARQLNLIPMSELLSVCNKYYSVEGCLLRYPGTTSYMSWDDHLALSCSSPTDRLYIRDYMVRHFFILPDGNWLGRFVVLVGVLLPFMWPLAAFAYIVDPFSGPASQTSGRQLLWLAGRWFDGFPPMRPFVQFWRSKMMKLYPQGFKSLCAIYYQDPDHPFHAAARDDFL